LVGKWHISSLPLSVHRPAADDNSLIGCTRSRSDRWLVAAYAYFVDSWCPFRCSFGCVLLLNEMFSKQCTVRQDRSDYLINLLWKLRLGFKLDSELHCFSIFSR